MNGSTQQHNGLSQHLKGKLTNEVSAKLRSERGPSDSSEVKLKNVVVTSTPLRGNNDSDTEAWSPHDDGPPTSDGRIGDHGVTEYVSHENSPRQTVHGCPGENSNALPNSNRDCTNVHADLFNLPNVIRSATHNANSTGDVNGGETYPSDTRQDATHRNDAKQITTLISTDLGGIALLQRL